MLTLKKNLCTLRKDEKNGCRQVTDRISHMRLQCKSEQTPHISVIQRLHTLTVMQSNLGQKQQTDKNSIIEHIQPTSKSNTAPTGLHIGELRRTLSEL